MIQMNKLLKLTVMTLLGIGLFSLIIVQCVAQSTTLTVSPSATELPSSAIGQTLTINITVNSVTSLRAFSFQVWWDPTVLNLTNVIEGDFLKSAGTTVFPWSRELLVGGLSVEDGVTQIDNTLLSYDSVNGSGTLAKMNFKVLKSGSSAVGLNATRLVGPGPSRPPIDHTSINGTVTILEAESPWSVTITSTTGGSTTPSGLVNVTAGEQLTVNATANSGYVFSHWLFDDQTQDANASITLPTQTAGSNHTLQAVFNQTSTPTEPETEPETNPETNPINPVTDPTGDGSSSDQGFSPEIYFMVSAGVVFAVILALAVFLQRRK